MASEALEFRADEFQACLPTSGHNLLPPPDGSIPICRIPRNQHLVMHAHLIAGSAHPARDGAPEVLSRGGIDPEDAISELVESNGHRQQAMKQSCSNQKGRTLFCYIPPPPRATLFESAATCAMTFTSGHDSRETQDAELAKSSRPKPRKLESASACFPRPESQNLSSKDLQLNMTRWLCSSWGLSTLWIQICSSINTGVLGPTGPSHRCPEEQEGTNGRAARWL